MSKNTDILMEDIPKAAFFSVAKYIRGVTYGKSLEINDEREGYNLLRANNITLSSNTLNFDDIKKIDFSANVKDIQMLRKNDILICAGSGSKDHIGKVAFIDEDMNYTFGGFMGVIRVDESIILPKFMFYILISPIFKNHLAKVSNSSTINNINNDTWNSFEVPVPPLDIQGKIVDYLNHFYDAKNKITSELLSEIQFRQQQFIFFRENLLTQNSQEHKLSDLCEIRGRIGFRGYTRNDIVEPGNGSISLSPSNIIDNELNFDDCTYISWEKYEESPEIMINEGDVLICKTGSTLGKVAYINTLPQKATINPQLVVLKNIKCNPQYLKYVVSSHSFQDEIQRKKGLGSVPNISQKELGNIIVKLPELNKQQQIVQTLNSLNLLITQLIYELNNEIEQRKAQFNYYLELLLQ